MVRFPLSLPGSVHSLQSIIFIALFSGFVGCMWAIAGVHDRAWGRRPVFGTIRFMNYDGCKRKFDIAKYMSKCNAAAVSDSHAGIKGFLAKKTKSASDSSPERSNKKAKTK